MMVVHIALLGLTMIVGIGVDPDPKLESKRSTLVRWSVDEPVVGVVDAIGRQGIEIRVDGQVIPISVPWYDVRELVPQTGEYRAYRQIAEDAWRAHTRLVRGDFFSAESIYNELSGQYLWRVGPQSADVSLGLARCRLDRRDRVDAVLPMLSWLRATTGDRFSGLRLIDEYDEVFGVFVGLPPVFGNDDRVDGLGELPGGNRITDRQRALFGYYQLALDRSVHRTPEAQMVLDELAELVRGREGRDSGMRLIEEMVIAQAHPDSQKRLASRAGLRRRIRTDRDTWVELWARLAIGVSLMGEGDVETNERGVIELIHVVVRLDYLSHPLSELASQIANEYFVRTDRAQWGAELMLEARSVSTGGLTQSILSKEHDAHE